MLRKMTIEDYENVSALWHKIKGFSIRSIDDSREGVERFLKRNPDTSVVAIEDGKVVGAILCGHDGRREMCIRDRWYSIACLIHGQEAVPSVFCPLCYRRIPQDA